MKKTYLSPLAVVLNITTATIIATSPGDTVTETVDGKPIDGDKAWSRRRGGHYDDWDDEEEEEY